MRATAHARIDGDKVQLLTRTGLDWSHRYKHTIEALHALKVKSAYLDDELCALNADGVPASSAGYRRQGMKAAPISLSSSPLIFFA
jgi:ATP-dependent DNA ligase